MLGVLLGTMNPDDWGAGLESNSSPDFKIDYVSSFLEGYHAAADFRMASSVGEFLGVATPEEVRWRAALHDLAAQAFPEDPSTTAPPRVEDPVQGSPIDWRARAEADAPVIVRAIVRAIAAGSQDEPAPGGILARRMVQGLVQYESDFAAEMLGRLASLVHSKEWRANEPQPLPVTARAYMDGLVPGVLLQFVPANAARTYSQTLPELTEAETTWLAALALLELSLGSTAAELPRPESRVSTEPRYVIYQYCISLGIVSFKRSSGIQMIPSGRSRVLPGLPYTFVSLFLGWWGIPWGPLWTLQTAFQNLRGGIDVTDALTAVNT